MFCLCQNYDDGYGLDCRSWTWPIFRKPDQPSPVCLPAVLPAPDVTVPPPAPLPHITTVAITFCVKSDGKDSDTVGDVEFSLSDGTPIGTVSIPSGGWGDNSKHTLSASVSVPLTQSQLAATVHTYMKFITHGKDDMLFAATTSITLSNGVTSSYCVDNQHAGGCGSGCFFSDCPTNVCGWTAPNFPFAIQTVAGGQCSC